MNIKLHAEHVSKIFIIYNPTGLALLQYRIWYTEVI